MTLKHIFNFSNTLTMQERFRRLRDLSAMEVAAHLPLRIRYWCTLQEMSRATRTSENIPATPLSDILNELERPKVMS